MDFVVCGALRDAAGRDEQRVASETGSKISEEFMAAAIRSSRVRGNSRISPAVSQPTGPASGYGRIFIGSIFATGGHCRSLKFAAPWRLCPLSEAKQTVIGGLQNFRL
jgi:hypothetical protein